MSLQFERAGAVARLTLSRPPHNFFDLSDLALLADSLDEVDSDPALRVTILQSSEKTFCAGADFGGSGRPDPTLIYAQAVRLAARRKPMIAAIGGPAVGGGLGLALVADFRVGSFKARFQANFVRLGISPGFGISVTLPRLIGAQAARNMLLTGRRVEGKEAHALGLLDQIVPDAELDAAARSLSETLAEGAPAAVVATRRLLDVSGGDGFTEAIRRELAEQAPLFASSNFEEGLVANRERRLPRFVNLQEKPA